jgi:DNA-directed RNA polymerase sigma subunit (sigma70/sigma32)
MMFDDTDMIAALNAAVRMLNPFEQWVIRERYGIDAGSQQGPVCYFHRTFMELSADCGLSPERIRQVERVALDKIRSLLGYGDSPCKRTTPPSGGAS